MHKFSSIDGLLTSRLGSLLALIPPVITSIGSTAQARSGRRGRGFKVGLMQGAAAGSAGLSFGTYASLLSSLAAAGLGAEPTTATGIGIGAAVPAAALGVYLGNRAGRRLGIASFGDPDEPVEQPQDDLSKNKIDSEVKKAEDKSKKYRDRVEVFALADDGTVYGGIWDKDNSFALPGGGIDEGEDIIEAGTREFNEETGLVLQNAKNSGVTPVVQKWTEEHRKSLPKDRQHFTGSRTYWIIGDVKSKEREDSKKLDKWKAKSKKFYTIDEVSKLMDSVKDPVVPGQVAARKKIIKQLRENSMNKQSDFQWSDVTPYAAPVAGGGLGALLGYLIAKKRDQSLPGVLGALAGGGLGAAGGLAANPAVVPHLNKALQGHNLKSKPAPVNHEEEFKNSWNGKLDELYQRGRGADATKKALGMGMKGAKSLSGSIGKAMAPFASKAKESSPKANLAGVAQEQDRALDREYADTLRQINMFRAMTGQPGVDDTGRIVGHRYDQGAAVPPAKPRTSGTKPNSNAGKPAPKKKPEDGITPTKPKTGKLADKGSEKKSSAKKANFDYGAYAPYALGVGGAGLGALIGNLLADKDDNTTPWISALLGGGAGVLGGVYGKDWINGLFADKRPTADAAMRTAVTGVGGNSPAIDAASASRGAANAVAGGAMGVGKSLAKVLTPPARTAQPPNKPPANFNAAQAAMRAQFNPIPSSMPQ